MMALNYSTRPMANGHASPVQAEDEHLYEQLLRVRDAVLSGKHPQFKLSAAAIERLKALANTEALAVGSEHRNNAATTNGTPASSSSVYTTNLTQPPAPPAASAPATSSTLPGLHASNPSLSAGASRPQPSAQFNPMFLEKADSLVRAEEAIKRRNLETELRSQVDRKNNSRDRDAADIHSSLDVTAILSSALARVPHVSGFQLSAKPESPASSSFDENDYYSSQVESEWSSPAGASKVSDRAADAPRATVGQSEALTAKSAVSRKIDQRSAPAQQSHVAYEIDDEDEEYTPPDASAFDAFDDNSAVMDISQDTPDDDDDSEYEPGEITQESNAPTPYVGGGSYSPRIPVIRNHLTHLAAPQPNRVSPLAVAKGPNIELELVNGCPQVVHKPQAAHNYPSRASTASPPGNGAGGGGKKRRNKKRKRDSEPSSKSKKKQRDRNAVAVSPPSPMYREPRIKDEPISPPPFGRVPDVPVYSTRPPYLPLDPLPLDPPGYGPAQYKPSPEVQALRDRWNEPSQQSPTGLRVVSSSQRTAHMDLRRVASLHHAQRPQSPAQQLHTPASQRTASMTYGDPRLSRSSIAPVDVQSPGHQNYSPLQYAQPEQYRSSPQVHQYQDPYARVQSPAMMLPPAAPPRRIVVDQHGNRYYAAEPVPAPTQVVAPRASVAPVDLGYERSQSRMTSRYDQPSVQYPSADFAMAPPPVPSRRPGPEVQYVDAHGYPIQQYASQPVGQQQVRYVEAPTSPVYQSTARYEPMPPPAQPTSPMYAPPPRSYSVRPEDPAQAAYARQASVAPVQYRPESSAAPVRAMSVMPGYDHGAVALPRAYSQVPQAVRYVDEHGQQVYPREIRQVPQEYRYQ